ncbi:MAG: RidA family protein [Proteobacteria bacterium]|jgi:2-iminobutanoate/2-iminopropanoate deaminase|nr:RidA family protein [Pseudomonadota bacterium]
MKKIILTKEAPAPIGPYSQAVEVGNFVFCSGQISIDPQTNNVFMGDVKTQTEMVMKNVEAVLKQAGLTCRNVIKTTIFLKDMADFVVVNEVYGRYFPENPPARSTVAVAGLPKGVSVEVEVIAHR